MSAAVSADDTAAPLVTLQRACAGVTHMLKLQMQLQDAVRKQMCCV